MLIQMDPLEFQCPLLPRGTLFQENATRASLHLVVVTYHPLKYKRSDVKKVIDQSLSISTFVRYGETEPTTSPTSPALAPKLRYPTLPRTRKTMPKCQATFRGSSSCRVSSRRKLHFSCARRCHAVFTETFQRLDGKNPRCPRQMGFHINIHKPPNLGTVPSTHSENHCKPLVASAPLHQDLPLQNTPRILWGVGIGGCSGPSIDLIPASHTAQM